jgi:hypothetical protein
MTLTIGSISIPRLLETLVCFSGTFSYIRYQDPLNYYALSIKGKNMQAISVRSGYSKVVAYKESSLLTEH